MTDPITLDMEPDMNAVAKLEPQIVTFSPVDPMVSMIERIVSDPSADMAKLERMLALKEQMDRSRSMQAFAAAFASAAAQFPAIPLNGTGNNQKPYAMLKDIIGLTRPILSAHGLALNFDVQTGDKVKVTARLSHREGHVQETSIVLPADTTGSKNAVQAIGSTQTYGQRYTAQAILGLSLGDDTDDDGAGASKATSKISEEQFRALRTLAEEVNADEAKFLAFFKIDNVVDLPAARFAEAEAMLRSKAKQRAPA